jgi:hypothetical protein
MVAKHKDFCLFHERMLVGKGSQDRLFPQLFAQIYFGINNVALFSSPVSMPPPFMRLKSSDPEMNGINAATDQLLLVRPDTRYQFVHFPLKCGSFWYIRKHRNYSDGYLAFDENI